MTPDIQNATLAATGGKSWHVASVAQLTSAISSASAGDTIHIAAGDYTVTNTNGIFVDRSLTFVSEGGRADFHAGASMRKGIFTIGENVPSTTIDGLGFYDARNGDDNGAGIRHQGGDLTVLNSYFYNNQDGILGYATTGREGNVYIGNSEFEKNGSTDGAHGIYIYSDTLTVENSHFHDTVVGHHIKTVSAENVIRGNVIDHGSGNASRSIDATGGGDLLVEGNTFVKSANSPNGEFILYDDYRTAEGPGTVVIQDNDVTNHKSGARFLVNSTDAVPLLADNDFTGLSASRLANGEIVQHGNVVNGVLLPPTGGEPPPPTEPPPDSSLLLSDSFGDGNATGWQAVDEGNREGPSKWSVSGGEVHQKSNIHNGNGYQTDHRDGTMLVWDEASARDWQDYTVSADLRSTDDDGIGLAFYYSDADNYYKLDLDLQRQFSTLFQVADGVETTLATVKGAGFRSGVETGIEISVSDDGISVLRDGQDIFGGPVQGGTLSGGTVALYSWGNSGANFDDVVVTALDSEAPPPPPPPPPPEEEPPPASSLLLADSFDDGNSAGWQVVDEGNREGPSKWSVSAGEAHQKSNIHNGNGYQTDHRDGTMLVWDEASARDWQDYTLSADLRSTDDDGIGLAFYYSDADNYYKLDLDLQRQFSTLFQVADGVETTLATAKGAGFRSGVETGIEISVSDDGISVLRDGQDIFGGPVQGGTLSGGTVALYSWGNSGANFDDVEVTAHEPAARVAEQAGYSVTSSGQDDGTLPAVELT